MQQLDRDLNLQIDPQLKCLVPTSKKDVKGWVGKMVNIWRVLLLPWVGELKGGGSGAAELCRVWA